MEKSRPGCDDDVAMIQLRDDKAPPACLLVFKHRPQKEERKEVAPTVCCFSSDPMAVL